MPAPARGGLRLFRLLGIDVYLHWSWAIVALIELQTRVSHYRSQAYNVAEYLALFLIVLTHEFGHALACRSVGGKAERILLWPLGGVAYVQPPARPGALLWSIAAGPLVNLFLAVVLTPFAFTLLALKGDVMSDPMRLLEALWIINIVLFVFNMLPVYPLDGGQIVRAILWFFVGPSRSLMAVSVVGICAAGAVLVVAAAKASIWWVAMAVFAGMRALAGMKAARAMARGGGAGSDAGR